MSLANKAKDCKAGIFDLDNTLVNGNVTEAVGNAYRADALMKGNLPAFESGMKALRRIKSMGEGELHEMGLPIMYRSLSENGIGTREEMYGFARSYIEGNKMEAVIDIASIFPQERPKVIITGSGSTVAQAAMDSLHMGHSASNIDLFADGKLVGVEMKIRKASDKVDAARKVLDPLGIRIEECVVVGDSSLDIELLKMAAVPVASPMAGPAVRAVRGIRELPAREIMLHPASVALSVREIPEFEVFAHPVVNGELSYLFTVHR